MTDPAHTTWIMVACAMVLLMTPALAFFYGGLVRAKNSLNTMMMSFAAMGVVAIVWALAGYSLAFAGEGRWIGGLAHLALRGVGLEAHGQIPHLLFMAYQGTFAVITAALISGAIVERMRFGPYLFFIGAWTLCVYAPVCHWVWGDGGWLARLGVLDFAGGAVVHINAGVSALALVLLLGRRRGFPHEAMEPNNIPLVIIGAGLLWFGWFGFNAGSALAANGLATTAFVNTNTAGAAAGLTWMLLSWRSARPTILGTATGAVAGLATVTPAAGYVTPMGAVGIGFLAGVACYYSLMFFKSKLGFDDSLDVFAVHGVGGILGMLSVGIFATLSVNAAGADGLVAGQVTQLLRQLLAIGVVAGYAFTVTWIIGKLIQVSMGLRVGQQEEAVGLDLSQHGERAYGGFVR